MRELKKIKSCPINSEKCEFKKSHGCIKYTDVNECAHCRSFRKRQAKHSRYVEKNRKYTDPLFVVKIKINYGKSDKKEIERNTDKVR